MAKSTSRDITPKKKDYVWNMLGSVCYSGSSFVYLMLVTRICGIDQGGIFALAYSTAQLLLQFGRYGMRTYQATDLDREYSFAEYGLSRVITCVGMVLLALPYCMVMKYNAYRFLVFPLVTAMKMIDAQEDVFHGELQRSGHVAEMGKTLFARNLFTCILFSVVILATRNLIVTVFVTTLLSMAFCQLINTRAIKDYCPRDKRRDAVNVRRLFVLCFPIFVSTFMSLLLYNIPKYAIDTYLTEADQAYYNILYMPSFVVTLFSEIITKPVLTSIAASWNEDLRPFVKIVLRNFALIVAGSLVVVLAGDLIGRRLLEIFYGQDLTAYRWHFVVLLIGGGLSALVYVTYNILISIRAQRFIIIGYLIVAAISIPLTYMVVSRAGMWGAVWAYTLTCLGLEVLFFGALATLVLKRQKASA